MTKPDHHIQAALTAQTDVPIGHDIDDHHKTMAIGPWAMEQLRRHISGARSAPADPRQHLHHPSKHAKGKR